MKNSIAIFAAIILMAGLSTKTMAQGVGGDLENTAVWAKIVVPISITEVTDLHFGTMLPGTGGTCVLNTANSRSFTGAIGTTVAPTSYNATYTITGGVSSAYILSLPSSPIVVTETAGNTATMTIDAWTVKFLGQIEEVANGATSQFDANGADAFTIGATLHVAAGQASGIYAGTFDVIADYN